MKLNNQVIVSLVTGICLIGLIVVLKNILLIPPDILSRDVIVYIIVYIGFITSLSAKDNTKKLFKYDTPLFWSILIILITLAIMAIYAI
jgi:membrane protease YdiL (CAAX protease family)